jgi:hypothetical protein
MTHILNLRSFVDASGTLTPVQFGDVPFSIRRVFWIYDVSSGAERAGHAHHDLQELILAVSGSFSVFTVDEHGPHTWRLNRADQGLLIPPLTWRRLRNFSTNAIALVLASTEYDRDDYIERLDELRAMLPALPEDWFSKRRFQEVEAWKTTR